jgi:argininosuccinate lyase
MSFSADYIRLVLNENFEDAKTLFAAPLLAIHGAHLVMLAEQGIVVRDDARAIRDALKAVVPGALNAAVYDGSFEDLFFYVNRLLADRCGSDVAGRLHTARSRNDIDVTMYRMLLRDWLLGLAESVRDLRRTLIALADAHRQSVIAAHTHSQPAQPTTLGHYFMAVVEQLERDTRRLMAAYLTTNCSPLGACAITGTGFPIDRERTSALLGFSGPTGNTYGSVATVDYLLESAGAAAVLLVGLGRVVQDLLLWSTREVGYLALPDGFVQVSSIMPQKRNPVALEHARALASRALGEVLAIAQSAHNTPFGDIVDIEDDLQPLAATGFRDARRAVSLVAATMAHAEFDVERMRQGAAAEWITVTELADVLVRERGLSFAVAHDIVTRFVALARVPGAAGTAAQLALAARQLGHDIQYTEDALTRILSPQHFVEVRLTPGGPSPAVLEPAIRDTAARLEADTAALASARQSLADAEARRRQAVDTL